MSKTSSPRSTATEKALAQLKTLNRLAQVISSTPDVREILQTILQESMNLTEADRGAILSLEPGQQRPMHTLFKSANTVTGDLNSAFSDLMGGWILKNHTHLLVDQLAEDARFLHARKWFPQVKAVLAVPMKLQKHISGIIILTKSEQFSNEDLDLLMIVASQCGQLLENAKRFEEISEENRYLRREVESRYDFREIIGNSPRMRQVFDLLERVIPGDTRILIEGESGTGKELIARTIHYHSPRKAKKFIAVDCGALPESLLESEFFGHVKGAFTGAISDKKGLFEEAHEGTLFLDEIANTNTVFQAKLLRAIQEGEIKPVGSSVARKVDVRIIAATGGRLKEKVAGGSFREDLYYRLNVITIDLPPLRERKEDIPALAEHFSKKYCEKSGKPCSGFTVPAMRLLEAYQWPGNIRELENTVERAVTLAHPEDQFIVPDLLPSHISGTDSGTAGAILQSRGKLNTAVEYLERQLIAAALQDCAENRTEAAARLGISRQTLISKIKKYNL